MMWGTHDRSAVWAYHDGIDQVHEGREDEEVQSWRVLHLEAARVRPKGAPHQQVLDEQAPGVHQRARAKHLWCQHTRRGGNDASDADKDGQGLGGEPFRAEVRRLLGHARLLRELVEFVEFSERVRGAAVTVRACVHVS